MPARTAAEPNSFQPAGERWNPFWTRVANDGVYDVTALARLGRAQVLVHASFAH